MNPADPNVGSVEIVAAALGELRDELVLVDGCAASLLIDASTAPPPRVTYDVDLIAVVSALPGYHRLEQRFSVRWQYLQEIEEVFSRASFAASCVSAAPFASASFGCGLDPRGGCMFRSM